jgi:hypothetical protein
MGTVQLVKRLYYDRYKDNPDYKILDNLSMADACGQEVFLGVIKQIQLGEPSFTSVDFDRWKEEGKLRDDQVILFRQLSPDLKLKNP